MFLIFCPLTHTYGENFVKSKQKQETALCLVSWCSSLPLHLKENVSCIIAFLQACLSPLMLCNGSGERALPKSLMLLLQINHTRKRSSKDPQCISVYISLEKSESEIQVFRCWLNLCQSYWHWWKHCTPFGKLSGLESFQ